MFVHSVTDCRRTPQQLLCVIAFVQQWLMLKAAAVADGVPKNVYVCSLHAG